MGTSTNYEKKWKTWFTEKFMKECAAYAVAFDMSKPGGLTRNGKAVGYEASFKIPEPALTKEYAEGAAEAPPDALVPVKPETIYEQLRTAFLSAGGRLDASVVDQGIKNAKAREADWPSTTPEQKKRIEKYLFAHGFAAPGSQAPISGISSSKRGQVQFDLIKPVLETLLDPDFGIAGPWMIGQKYNMWDLTKVRGIDFDIVISSIMDREAGSSDISAVFAPLREACRMPSTDGKILPLVYSAPVGTSNPGITPQMLANTPGIAKLGLSNQQRNQFERDIKEKVLTKAVWEQELAQGAAFKYTYLVRYGQSEDYADSGGAKQMPAPIVIGHPFRFKNMASTYFTESSTYSDAWASYSPWNGVQKIGNSADVSHLGTWKIRAKPALLPESAIQFKFFNESAWDQLGGVGCVRPAQFWFMVRDMVLHIGRSKWKTSSGKSWYDQIIYEILWGAQDPTPPGPPRPRTGGSRPSRRPKPPMNVGKRKIRAGKEIHAIEAQCWLLENIEQLASLRESETYKNVGVLTHGLPSNIVSKLNHGSDGRPATWPPREGGPDSEAYTLQNMCPDLWALMTPHFELYRVNYLKKRGDTVPALVPQSENRIPFSNFVDQNDLTQITDGSYGRLGGAGMKSFTWSLDGTQPAEVDNMISAQLTMHFQSVYDLFRHNKIPGTGTATTPPSFAAGIPNQPGYLDLIIGSGIQGRPESSDAKPEDKDDSPGNVCDAINNEYVGENFRIKVICGWSTPPGLESMDIPGYTADDLKNIKSALEGSRRAFYLQIVSHEINFEQDGTLELVIQYQASMSGITRSPTADIFVGHEIYKNSLEKLDEQLSALDQEELDAREAAGPGGSLGVGEEERFQKEKQAILEKQIILMQKTRAEKYKEFLGSLAQHNKVRVAMVDTADLLAPLNKMTPEDRRKAAKVRRDKVNKLANAAKTAAAQAAAELESLKVAEEAAKNKLQEKNENLKRLADNAGFLSLGAKKTGIPFMYLGDLIDALLKSRLPHLIEEQAGTNTPPLQVVLANVEMINPLLAYQILDVKFSCPSAPKNQEVTRQLAQIDPFRFRDITGIFEYMNIGSIPISLDKFNEWFVNTVIRGKKESYKLLDFIKDICAALVTDAYSSTCFEKVFKFNITFNSSNFRMADSFKGCAVTLDDMALSARKAQNRDRQRLTPESKHGPSIPTAVFYSVDSRPRSGDRISDLQEGIYHYYLGGRCGLAKEISFQRQDMPFYREARISKDGALGAQQLKELYTVQMNMIGNTLQKNGTYVYIDPIAIGGGSSRALGGVANIARMIGLGGYFLVNSVTNEISPAGYTTTVSAMQEMSAMDGGDNVKIVSINGDALPIPQEPEPDADPGEACIVWTQEVEDILAEMEEDRSLAEEDRSEL